MKRRVSKDDDPDGHTETERPSACGSRSRIKSGTLAPLSACKSVLRRPGGSSEEPEPVPIPNTAVKLLSADGTKSQGLEE